VKPKDSRYNTLRRNRVNQTRLRTVSEFLHQNGDKFVTVPICAIRDRLDPVIVDKPEISVSARQAIARMAENAINDLVWWY
jgi:hypothetical protein